MKFARDFDPKLKLRFNRRGDYYYLTRSSLKGFKFSDVQEDDPIWYSHTPYGEAFRANEVVVVREIPVQKMENIDECKKDFYIFWKENFIPEKARTKEGRVKAMEAFYDDLLYKETEFPKKHLRDEIRHFSRDVWRSKVQPHVYFGGLNG